MGSLIHCVKLKFSKLFLSLVADLSSQFLLKSPRIIISFLHESESIVENKQLNDSTGAEGGIYILPIVKYLF